MDEMTARQVNYLIWLSHVALPTY